ncbi:unnamed protein product [Ceutorhynchus assimilis]|uniref:Uncharacterized protein n=1 Tax=Ceutorhynchus assimilis TaxID=467358 RepID=A0A9P0DG52_9CUCU|nr:unnamed protein product [Ceutorhynchus assimilis]
MSENNGNYENINMSMDPEQVEKLCEGVRQKDLEILDLDRQIEWYKNEIAELERNFAASEKRRKEIKEENKELDKQYEQLQFFHKSAEKTREIEQMALSAFHALHAYTAEEEKSVKLQALKQKEQLDKNYMEAEKKMTEHPLYQELEKDRAKALEADMETRQLRQEIAYKKYVIAKEAEIKKTIKDQYLLVQQMEENLEHLKAEESEKMKKLLKLQEGEKMGRVKMMHIAQETESQHIQIDQVANTSGMSESVLLQTKGNEWDTSKLHLILEEHAPRKIVAPHVIPEKIRILNQNIIVSATAPSPEPEKRKLRDMDLSTNWPKKKTSSNVSESLTQDSEANASIEMSPDTSQESQCSLQDGSMKYNTPQNVSLFKKPMPVQVFQLSKQNQIQSVDTVSSDGMQMMTGYSSQAQLSTPSFGSQLVSTAGSQITPQSILTSSKDPNGFNDTFREQPKSVRFNLERSPSPLKMTIEKPKCMGYDFSKRAHLRGSLGEGHENPFDMFPFGNSSTQFSYKNVPEQPSSLNSSFNLSLPEAEDEDAGGMELINSGNENITDDPFGNGGEVPGTGSAGGFFSFNPQGFKFPFQ